jgi:hypothetical protein
MKRGDMAETSFDNYRKAAGAVIQTGEPSKRKSREPRREATARLNAGARASMRISP